MAGRLAALDDPGYPAYTTGRAGPCGSHTLKSTLMLTARPHPGPPSC